MADADKPRSRRPAGKSRRQSHRHEAPETCDD